MIISEQQRASLGADGLGNSLANQPRLILLGELLAFIALIAWGDWVTGYEISFGVFYTIPVITAVWLGSRRSGISLAVLVILVRHIVDVLSKHPFSHEWIHYWNDGVRLSYLLMIVYGATAAKFQIDSGKKRIRTLEGILPVCTSCQRIRDDSGHWSDISVYLSSHTEAEPTAKLCPDCAKRHYIGVSSDKVR